MPWLILHWPIKILTDTLQKTLQALPRAGFVASNEDGISTTLGGAVLITAAIFAAALDASLLEIWTEVSGWWPPTRGWLPMRHHHPPDILPGSMELFHLEHKFIYPLRYSRWWVREYPFGSKIHLHRGWRHCYPTAGFWNQSSVTGISSINNIAWSAWKGVAWSAYTGFSKRLLPHWHPKRSMLSL